MNALRPLRVGVDEARRIACELLEAAGADADHARCTADSLLYADRSGVASHGLLRLPLYVAAAEQGGINVDPAMRWLPTREGAGLLEADGAFGQVAMTEALRYAREQLAGRAVVVVAVQGSSHYGAGAYWTDQLALDGYIGLCTSTTGPVVAPHGAARAVLGTNPFSLSAPADEQSPLSIDMATSTGAYGKVIAARNAGDPLPEGWAVDSRGNPTTDPEAAMSGALTAFGGHKGSALAVGLEALSVVLGRSGFAFETQDIWANPASRMNVGHTLVVIDPEAFTGLSHTRERVSELRRTVRAAGEDVLAPGDREAAARAQHREHIMLAASTVHQIQECAAARGVSPITTVN
ncbi:Ldh family oxidoreductase [Sediminivirga luteola]|uniref:Ldh family oxidoreductase n=1 Tax=Sediminivirga luteola TaxID=1774748 RepID=UPI001F574798|nr:Ldh family oxidoreductase [Sediminivirga luteola]MCI2266747.1 Ldh family oxidoreductase [Sediminivirga luteola]